MSDDRREKVGEKEKEVRARVRTHGETENGSRSDNGERRTLAWPAKRLYAVCVLYGNTARVPTPIFIHRRYNALLLPSGTIHLSPGPRGPENSSPTDGTTRLVAGCCHPIRIYIIRRKL